MYFYVHMSNESKILNNIIKHLKILFTFIQFIYTNWLKAFFSIGQEAIVRTGHGTTDWFQIGKGVRQGCILSSCLFNLYAEYIMQMVGWMKHKLESRLPGEISILS